MPKSKNEPKLSAEELKLLHLKTQIADLEHQLKVAEMKVLFHSKMIDIAEERYKITIRKQDDDNE